MFRNEIIFSLLFTITLVAACDNGKEKYAVSGASSIVDSLFIEKNDLRNYSFGIARENFDVGDDSTILANEKDHVVEQIFSKSADSTFAEISYHFENNQFQSAEINIFSKTDSLNKQVSDTLVNEMNKRFGRGSVSRGFYTWKSRSTKGYSLEIFMGDMSFEIGSPAIQIQIHADLIEKPLMAKVTYSKP